MLIATINYYVLSNYDPKICFNTTHAKIGIHMILYAHTQPYNNICTSFLYVHVYIYTILYIESNLVQ